TPAGGRRALRVETLEGDDRPLSVTGRPVHASYPSGVTATYGPTSRSLLFAWLPLPSSDIRIERIGPDGRGSTSRLPILAEEHPMPRGAFGLACSGPLRDCL